MNDSATAIGNMFMVPAGRTIARGAKASPSGSKGAKALFADAAPLARLRDEIRSYKTSSREAATTDDSRSAQGTHERSASVEPPVHADDPGTQPTDAVKDPAEDETVSPAMAHVSELPITIDTVSTAPVDAAFVLGAQGDNAEATDGAASKTTAEQTMASDGGQVQVTMQAVSADGQGLNQTLVDAAAETADGRNRSAQTQMNASATAQGVETSGKAHLQEQPTLQNPNAQEPLPVATANAEEARAVGADAGAATRQQAAEAMGTEPKVATANREAVETVKAVDVQTENAAKPQTQPSADVQPGAEASKDSDAGRMQVASRASQGQESDSDATRRQDAQASSQQDSSARPQNPAQPTAAADAAGKTPAEMPKQSLQAHTDATVVSETHSTEASPRAFVQATSSVPLDSASTRGPVQDIGDQILNSVHASLARADKQVQVRLDPPELGTVTIRLSEQGDQIRGFLEVGRDETRREIEQALPQVLKGLQEAGVQVRRIEVVVSDQPDRGLARDQLPQDASAQQQQHPDQQGYRPSHESAADWPASSSRPQGGPGPDDSSAFSGQGVQDRIDMLV